MDVPGSLFSGHFAMTIYAIGDIHGQLDKLRAIETLIAEDMAKHGTGDALTVCVGDYVDRGPDVPGVLDHLSARLDSGDNVVLLKGNHDRMMAQYLRPDCPPDPRKPHLHWLGQPIGGRATLAAYGIDVGEDRPLEDIHAEARKAVPQSHIDFLNALPTYHQQDGFVFVHAGILPGVAMEDQLEDDLVWIRDECYDDPRDHGFLLVHGHTPVEQVTHYGNRMNLDTGAAYGRALSAVVFDKGDVWQVTESGREPVRRA